MTTVARGPKPVAALREFDIQPTIKVPEPNTWREVLKTLDAQLQLANQTIALQEYGKPNTSLVAGLEARGATVRTIKVYNWDFPEDIGPLEANRGPWRPEKSTSSCSLRPTRSSTCCESPSVWG